MLSRNIIALVSSVLAGAVLGWAWNVPSTTLCVVLGWACLPLFYTALSTPGNRSLRLFLAGIAKYVFSCYWVLATVGAFGSLPSAPALGMFATYLVVSAVQFMVWGFSFTHLPNWCSRWGVRMAVSWLIAQHFWLRVFPWDIGHTQLLFVPFAQLAGLLGVTGISFVMMWCVEVLCAWRAVSAIARLLALITFGSSLAYGIWIKEEIARLPPNKISTVMIQGRASLKKDGQIHTLSVDREFYLRNSSLVADKDILIIWPESTIAETLPDVTHASQSNLLPYFGDGSAFFVGGVTNTGEEGWRNTSFLIRPDGSVDKPYRKTVLMPFGEHAPFSEWFPWLQAINHTAGDLIFRSNPTVLSYTLSDGRTVRIAPAICYEDLVPRLAQRATAAGAQLIINQTNELWLGNTVAPHQHHMMASFRAIENRRFLLRSTHTGVTAVVDPLGQTVAKLPSFSEAVLPMEVSLLNYRSPFTYLPVPLIWLAFAIIAGLVIVRRALRR